MTKFLPTAFLIALALVATGSAMSLQSEQKKELKVVKKVEPDYTEEARAKGVEGNVVLQVTVEDTGEVSIVKVQKGDPLLSQAAVDAVKQWRFSNPFNDPVTIDLTINFSLDGQAPPRAEPPALKNTHRVDAVYPEEAKRKGVQGEVKVEITVNDKGEVIAARATSGNELIRQAAIDAAKQFRFSNALNATVAATLTFNFVLGEKK